MSEVLLDLDILEAVFRHLNLKALGRAARVCTVWQCASECERLWQQLCFDHSPQAAFQRGELLELASSMSDDSAADIFSVNDACGSSPSTDSVASWRAPCSSRSSSPSSDSAASWRAHCGSSPDSDSAPSWRDHLRHHCTLLPKVLCADYGIGYGKFGLASASAAQRLQVCEPGSQCTQHTFLLKAMRSVRSSTGKVCAAVVAVPFRIASLAGDAAQHAARVEFERRARKQLLGHGGLRSLCILDAASLCCFAHGLVDGIAINIGFSHTIVVPVHPPPKGVWRERFVPIEREHLL